MEFQTYRYHIYRPEPLIRKLGAASLQPPIRWSGCRCSGPKGSLVWLPSSSHDALIVAVLDPAMVGPSIWTSAKLTGIMKRRLYYILSIMEGNGELDWPKKSLVSWIKYDAHTTVINELTDTMEEDDPKEEEYQ